jgi:hypothetical protein
MKKTASLLTGFLLIIISLHAQKKQPKFLVELGVGPSFPIGTFADKTYQDYNETNFSGMAKTGLAAQLSLGYYINESVGLLLLPSFTIHSQDPSGYEEALRKTYSILSGNQNMPSRIEVKAKSWKIAKLMVGGFFITSLTSASELSLITKLTVGVCKTNMPEYSYTTYDQAGMLSGTGVQNKTSLPLAFCYQVSVGLKYKLGNQLYLLFDVNSFNSNLKKDFNANTPIQTIRTAKYKVAEVNVLAGIGINF